MFQTEHIDEIFANARSSLKEIELSIIDACNRQCAFCPKSDKNVAPNTWLEMPIGLWKKIANDLRYNNFDGLVMLCGYGEPLLNKNILDIVREFSFTKVDMVTNGDYLTMELAGDLISNGINKILISQYDDTDFTKIQERYPEHIIIRDRRYGLQSETNRALGTVNNTPCYYPFYMLTVDWNGDVYPCCQDWNRRDKIGNLSFQSIGDIWTSRKLDRFRANLIDKGRVNPPCSSCNVNGKLRGKDNFDKYLQRRLR